jgi:hypothetical protein
MPGSHFIPPSLGEEGFFLCTKPAILEMAHRLIEWKIGQESKKGPLPLKDKMPDYSDARGPGIAAWVEKQCKGMSVSYVPGGVFAFSIGGTAEMMNIKGTVEI